MSKQYLSIRALRCATIALLLAAGLEGLKRVVFPSLSAGRSHIAAIFACVFAVFFLNLKSLRSGKVKQEKLSTNIIESLPAVSYTHLDVYKRQIRGRSPERTDAEDAGELDINLHR